MANYLPFFKICKARKPKPKTMLKSVEVPIQDINKCITEHKKGFEDGGLKNVTIGHNICAGSWTSRFNRAHSCQVRFRMQK